VNGVSGATLHVDGVEVSILEGDTIASVLMRSGQVSWRRTRFGGRPRGPFCGIGACQDCLVRVDGVDGVRACLTPALQGAAVTTHAGAEGGDSDG